MRIKNSNNAYGEEDKNYRAMRKSKLVKLDVDEFNPKIESKVS